MKRIGMLRIAQESNALSPYLSELVDFAHDKVGDELLHITSAKGHEVEGFMKNAELSGFRAACAKRKGIEVVPLFSLWAVPGGPLSTEALAAIRDRLQATLDQAGPLDGVFVSLHGAMVGEGGTRPESILLADLRDRLGPDVPIAASIDLHAHITADFIQHLTVVSAYRTNPHRDHASTGFRAATMLLDVLDGTLVPTMAWRHLPMVMGGGSTLDFQQPCRSLFRKMTRMEREQGARDVSLLMSHLWLDSPDLGWATVVVTHNDQALAERLADRLADEAWSLRFDLPPVFPGPEQALETVRQSRWQRRAGTIVLSDASDMVGCGAPGNNTRLLRALLDASDLTSLAAIRDDETLATLWDTAIGTTVTVSLGGRFPDSSPAITVTGVLTRKHDGNVFGRRALLDLGHVQLVVTTRAPLVMQPAFYRQLGLSTSRADICMVKSLFPFRLYFALQNRKTLYARTEGASDFDAALRIDFDMPTHPKDFVESWRPADRVRRLGERP